MPARRNVKDQKVEARKSIDQDQIWLTWSGDLNISGILAYVLLILLNYDKLPD